MYIRGWERTVSPDPRRTWPHVSAITKTIRNVPLLDREGPLVIRTKQCCQISQKKYYSLSLK